MTAASPVALSSLPSWRQVPTTRECVGFGALQEVAVGLVQPASAVLYDYYSPGEHLGSKMVGVSPLIREMVGRAGEAWAPQGPHLLLPCLDHKCSVFYAGPTKSKLLSTLCSADVCQCAEGEMRPGWG